MSRRIKRQSILLLERGGTIILTQRGGRTLVSLLRAVPTPIVQGTCFILSARHLVERSGYLNITQVSEWKDGLANLWPPQCRYREIQLVISSISLAGQGFGWFGLIVTHPQNENPISLWITGQPIITGVKLQVITTRGYSGAPAVGNAVTLVDRLTKPVSYIILGVRFDGLKAYPTVGNVSYPTPSPVVAEGYPNSFSIVYDVAKGSNLEVAIDSVRLEPATDAPECQLP